MGMTIGPDIPALVGRKGSRTAEAGKGRAEHRPVAEEPHAKKEQSTRADDSYDTEKVLADVRVSPDAAPLSRAPSEVGLGADLDPETAMDAAERSRNLISTHPRVARTAQALRMSPSVAETFV
jgi:hypothetical protein